MELRKAKKDDQLTKRRNMDEDTEPGSPLQDRNAQASCNIYAKALKIVFIAFFYVTSIV